MMTRRSCLARFGFAFAAATSPLLARAPRELPVPGHTPAATDGFKLAIAGYTFNKFKLEQALEMTRAVDVHYLCIKDFHLPLDSDEAAIAAFHETCGRYGVTGYGVGPIYMGSPEEVNRAFDYARRVGTRTLVGVPFKQINGQRIASRELLQIIDRKVREFDIDYAIHNHGPDMPELFPTAESAMDLIHDLDPRVGLCLDIGHELRAGKDPAQAVSAFPERIHDLHLKNVTSADKEGRGIELPRGAIHLPDLVRTLRRTGYHGMCSLEYEKDMDDPLTGIAECVGYFRGLADAIL